MIAWNYAASDARSSYTQQVSFLSHDRACSLPPLIVLQYINDPVQTPPHYGMSNLGLHCQKFKIFEQISNKIDFWKEPVYNI